MSSQVKDPAGPLVIVAFARQVIGIFLAFVCLSVSRITQKKHIDEF